MTGETVLIGEDVDVKSSSTIDYIWNVENFKELGKSGPFSSPTFYGDSTRAEKWKLCMEFLKEDGDMENSVRLGITLVESKSIESVKAESQFNFLDSENKIVMAGPIGFTQLQVGKGLFATYPYKGILEAPLPVLISGSTLRVHCQVSTITTRNLKRKFDDEEDFSVKKQFKSFFSNGNFSDVTLKTENTLFPACKVILAAHSPVFNAMFSSGMRESTDNMVKIEDFSDETVKGFLEFLYTGETQILKENATELLKIADKYQVMELKKKAESVLLGGLHVKNVVDILILAHFHSPTILKPKVIGFVNRFLKNIQKTQAYKDMARNFPDILLDLYADVSSAENQNKT